MVGFEAAAFLALQLQEVLVAASGNPTALREETRVGVNDGALSPRVCRHLLTADVGYL